MDAAYSLPEGVIHRPAAWADHTVNTFVLDSGGQTASFVMSRATPPAGVTLGDFVAAELHRMSHSLPDYVLTWRGGIEIAGQVTDLLDLRWTARNGPVAQLLTFLPIKNRMLIMAGTCPAPMPAGIRTQILSMMTGFVPAPGSPAHA